MSALEQQSSDIAHLAFVFHILKCFIETEVKLLIFMFYSKEMRLVFGLF